MPSQLALAARSVSKMRRGTIIFLVINLLVIGFLLNAFSTLIGLLFEDGSWVCYRLSGTEPVVRAYTEAKSEAESAKLTEAAKKWVLE